MAKEESAPSVSEGEPPQAQDFKLEAPKAEPAQEQSPSVEEPMQVDQAADSINAQKVQVAE